MKHAETAARARLSLLAPSPPHARPLSHSAARACRLHSRRRGCVPAWLVQSAGRRRRAVRQRAARAHTESRPVLRIAPIFRGRASTETAPSRPLCPRRSRASTRSRASKQGRQRSAAPSLVERGGGRGERARRALSHRTVAEGETAPARARTRGARRDEPPPRQPSPPRAPSGPEMPSILPVPSPDRRSSTWERGRGVWGRGGGGRAAGAAAAAARLPRRATPQATAARPPRATRRGRSGRRAAPGGRTAVPAFDRVQTAASPFPPPTHSPGRTPGAR